MAWYQWIALFALIIVGGGYGYWKFVLSKQQGGGGSRPGGGTARGGGGGPRKGGIIR